MARTIIGTGTTNNSGIAKLDKDSNNQTITDSYTGTGAGYIEVVAVCDGVESDPFTILDCAFYDTGVTGAKNSNWTIPSSITETVEDTGTTLSASASSSTAKRAYAGSINGDFEMVTTLKTTGSQIRIGVRDTSGNIAYRQVSYDDWADIKIKLLNGTLTINAYIDSEWTDLGTISTSSTAPDLTGTLSFMIYIYNTSAAASVTFKELKVYPI